MLHTPSAKAMLPRHAAVTSDSWTSAKKETYTSLSLHVVGPSVHEVLSFPFDIEKVEGRTYGVNIADKITLMAGAQWSRLVDLKVLRGSISTVVAFTLQRGSNPCIFILFRMCNGLI